MAVFFHKVRLSSGEVVPVRVSGPRPGGGVQVPEWLEKAFKPVEEEPVTWERKPLQLPPMPEYEAPEPQAISPPEPKPIAPVKPPAPAPVPKPTDREKKTQMLQRIRTRRTLKTRRSREAGRAARLGTGTVGDVLRRTLGGA